MKLSFFFPLLRIRRLGVLSVLLCALWTSLSMAQVMPLLNWQSSSQQEGRESTRVPLQGVWQVGRIESATISNAQFIEPEKIWTLEARHFAVPQASGAIRLKTHERFIARFSVQTKKEHADLLLSLLQPRLDAAHVSYRYGNNAWKTLSSGDTIAMNRWDLPDTQPSFSLNTQDGQIDVVLQMAHRGPIRPVAVLQEPRAYLQERSSRAWINGLLVSMCVLTAVVGLLSALNHRRSSFLSVTLAGLLMAMLLFFNSGDGGQFFFTDSEVFNDQIKLAVNWIWSTSLPLASVLVLNLNKRTPRIAWMFMTLAVLGLLSAPWLTQYERREMSFIPIQLSVIGTFALGLLMLAWVTWRGWRGNLHLNLGLGLMLVLPILRWVLFMRQSSSLQIDQITAFTGVIASLLLLRGLFIFYQHGRHVMAQSRLSPLRDPLTGLLNREGLQSLLKKMQAQHAKHPSAALWLYLQLDPQQIAEQEFGEEGVDVGLVQIAANLSTNLSSADCLARVSRSAFVAVLAMPVNEAQAARTAQKLLSSLMIMSERGTPLAINTRMALAWLPLYGYDLQNLRTLCRRLIAELPEKKHIAWLGGSSCHTQAIKSIEDLRQGRSVQTPEHEITSDRQMTPPYNSSAYKSNSALETQEIREKLEKLEAEMLNEPRLR